MPIGSKVRILFCPGPDSIPSGPDSTLSSPDSTSHVPCLVLIVVIPAHTYTCLCTDLYLVSYETLLKPKRSLPAFHTIEWGLCLFPLEQISVVLMADIEALLLICLPPPLQTWP
jgi:hypothetical protein